MGAQTDLEQKIQNFWHKHDQSTGSDMTYDEMGAGVWDELLEEPDFYQPAAPRRFHVLGGFAGRDTLGSSLQSVMTRLAHRINGTRFRRFNKLFESRHRSANRLY